ncbi:hypothetical protein CPB85DRAFT_1415191 [Mucidula mucida]|nr:hypothetical protein CPB85DRAFT_1415191 [Mucidula mucida]
MEPGPSAPSRARNADNTITPYLTTMAHFSSPFISTFLLIHLSAPIMANLGGSSLASQTMLLGREYYQTSFGEKYLVLAPIAIHTTSALVKRVIKPSRRITSLLTMTGYAVMILFLPVHFMTHRILPTSPEAPIYEVGPSELDYEFVKFGLQQWPWKSAFLYGGLVLFMGMHMVDGAVLLWNTYLAAGSSRGRVKDSPKKFWLSGMVSGMVVAGLAAVAVEAPLVFSSTAKRFESVFLSSWFYRL